MYDIDFHADDYAASIENSKRLIELVQAGRIDSFSVIPNMGCYEECMKLLKDNWKTFPKKPLISVHINLIDGYWLSSKKTGRIIKNSWGRIFLHTCIPDHKRNRLLASYSAEIEAQIKAVTEKTKDLRDDNGDPIALRIDSHVHTHMIPLVFDALMDALARTGLRNEVSFIRCSTEPLSMFLFTPGIAGTIPPINIVKNIMIHILSHFVRDKLRGMNIDTGRLFGVAMTGEMDLKRVNILLPKMIKYAKQKDAYLEILSHPGRSAARETAPEYGPDDIKAFTSANRDVEYRMLMEVKRPE